MQNRNKKFLMITKFIRNIYFCIYEETIPKTLKLLFSGNLKFGMSLKRELVKFNEIPN